MRSPDSTCGRCGVWNVCDGDLMLKNRYPTPHFRLWHSELRFEIVKFNSFKHFSIRFAFSVTFTVISFDKSECRWTGTLEAFQETPMFMCLNSSSRHLSLAFECRLLRALAHTHALKLMQKVSWSVLFLSLIRAQCAVTPLPGVMRHYCIARVNLTSHIFTRAYIRKSAVD